MDIKGVCYDVGRVYGGRFLTRPVFDPAVTGRELQIIRDDLHANAVRFQGRDISRLMTAAAGALELGLQVWFSPEMFEQSRETTLAYLVRAAAAAESLRQRFGGRLAGRLVRPRLKKGSHLRDEGHQARELTKTLGILDAEGADGAFVWTFADPWLTYSKDPRHDLDMTATSLVKTYARGHGSTYPDLPWEPKQAFGAVADFYATH